MRSSFMGSCGAPPACASKRSVWTSAIETQLARMPARAYLLGRALRAVARRVIVEGDVSALGGEREPDGAPQPLPRARHQHHGIAQSQVHASAILSAAEWENLFPLRPTEPSRRAAGHGI